MYEPLQWSFECDDASCETARVELRRALVVQNAATARRLDPLGGSRTEKNERRLRRFGLALCSIGVLLAAVLLVGRAVVQNDVAPKHVAMLVFTVVAWLLFAFATQARRALKG